MIDENNDLTIKFNNWKKDTEDNNHNIFINIKNFEKAFTEYKENIEDIHIEDLNEVFTIVNITMAMFDYINHRTKNKRRKFTTNITKLFQASEKAYFDLEDLKVYVDGESKDIINNLLIHYKEFLFDLDVVKNKFNLDENNFYKHNNILKRRGKNHKIIAHTTYQTNLKYRDINSNYRAYKNSYSTSTIISYNDVLRITLIKLETLIPFNFDNIIDLILSPLYQQFKKSKLKHKSLMQNNHLMKYNTIYLPNLRHLNNTVCLELTKYKDKKTLLLFTQFEEIIIGDNFNDALDKFNQSYSFHSQKLPLIYKH